ncbi:hypothetical protein FCU45_04715 [Sulfurimonas crateris]|uniref:N-acetyltransferase domain-containing protein n=1 Tax=Sulfurimonas crateris TaxID=2574727 RepID=A0A4U2Z6R8_9BACT|nr:hypothetical protein [Sulfurimonas crateris]TKI69917.1 hypothetical protein FCU45_04715 [Sulfurimonas crateris]
MKKLKLITDDDFERIYELQNQERIKIILDEMGEEILVKTLDDKKIGSIELHDNDGNFYILRMFLDELDSRYTNQGIGIECLLFHKEMFGSIITCAQDDGNTRSDGSHLTGGAPGFMLKRICLTIFIFIPLKDKMRKIY